ncbi:hypothetical protein [Mycolicibacterium thermoresistibile]
MSSPTIGAGRLRGALVGLCSAVLSAAAHGIAGGHLPGGGALLLFALTCAVIGALSSGVFAGRPSHHILRVSGALIAGQAGGHFALVVADGSGLHCPTAFSPEMLVAHGLAAPVCALLISLVEHLYAVCVSALSWLRLFFVDRSHPPAVAPSRPTESVAVRRFVLTPCGMRAPPAFACA